MTERGVLLFDLAHTSRVGHDDKGFEYLEQVQDDWPQVHSHVVNVHVETVALVRAEAIS